MNIKGEFTINLAGQDRVMRASFDAVEMLEGNGLKRPILEALADGINGKWAISDMATVFYAGFVANKDTRLTRADVGNALLDEGPSKFFPLYLEFLTYFITGGKDARDGAKGE
jgi:hypothetical protein